MILILRIVVLGFYRSRPQADLEEPFSFGLSRPSSERSGRRKLSFSVDGRLRARTERLASPPSACQEECLGGKAEHGVGSGKGYAAAAVSVFQDA